MRGLVNGIGGTVMEQDEWRWPENPDTPRDIIAGHLRNWGKPLAYSLADTLLIELVRGGFQVARATETNMYAALRLVEASAISTTEPDHVAIPGRVLRMVTDAIYKAA